MKKYLFLLGKRLARLLPMVFCAALVLFAGAAVLFAAAMDTEEAGQQKFSVALCGSTEDPLMQLGISALQTMDDTRFSVALQTLSEADAREALYDGMLDAYVLIPEGFLHAALQGNVPSLQYVTLAGNVGVAALFQQEVTQVISEILLSAQKGVYGIAGALQENGLGSSAYALMNDLALKYVALALQRNRFYRLEVLGIGSGLDLGAYLCCGFGVVLSLLLCLSFAGLLVQRDVSLNRMLAAKGLHPALQALGEFLTLPVGLGLLMLPAFALLGAYLPFDWRQFLPVLLVSAAMSFFLFSLTSQMISAVLLHFLASLGLCLVSGCLYPLSFFPESIQRLAVYLPTNACREYLTAAVNGTRADGLGLLGWGICFLTAALWLRSHRIRRAAL